MIKEYSDDLLGESATTKLNRDIEHNKDVTFEIVGYSTTIQNGPLPFIKSSILVKWGELFENTK